MLIIGRDTLLPLFLVACLQQTVFAEDGDIFDMMASSIKKGAAIGDRYLVAPDHHSRRPV
jgi:hypothetical protein